MGSAGRKTWTHAVRREVEPAGGGGVTQARPALKVLTSQVVTPGRGQNLFKSTLVLVTAQCPTGQGVPGGQSLSDESWPETSEA